MIAAGAAVGFLSIAALPSAADNAAFDRLDKNKDGLISVGEILPGEDEDIIDRLDTDQSGDVTRQELDAADDRVVIEKKLKVLQLSVDRGEAGPVLEIKTNVTVKDASETSLSEEESKALLDSAEAGRDSSMEPNVEIEETIGD